jgi:hypothetical protein
MSEQNPIDPFKGFKPGEPITPERELAIKQEAVIQQALLKALNNPGQVQVVDLKVPAKQPETKCQCMVIEMQCQAAFGVLRAYNDIDDKTAISQKTLTAANSFLRRLLSLDVFPVMANHPTACNVDPDSDESDEDGGEGDESP